MKHQYVGDVNDFRKYALLRYLSRAFPIGVCWMLTSDDTRSDGNKTSYLGENSSFRQFDPALFDALKIVRTLEPYHRLRYVEENELIPSAVFFNSPVPDAARARELYFLAAFKQLQPNQLIFFDPDNGLEVKSKPFGSKGSSKYVFFNEIEAVYRAARSALIYQHFPRIERRPFIEGIVDKLVSLLPGSHIWTFHTAHVVFFLIIHPRQQEYLSAVVQSFDIISNDMFIQKRRAT